MNKQNFIKIKIILLTSLVLVVSSCTTLVKKEIKIVEPTKPTLLTMPVGDLKLKSKFLNIKPNDIYRAKSGKKISFDEMIDELASKKVVFLGETHTSMNIHNGQDRILRALYERNPDITIGMEFFKRRDNEALKEWSVGKLTEEELIYKTDWYTKVGFNFGYYRSIMNFAKDKGLAVEGINIPRTLLRKVSQKGIENLTEMEKKTVGTIDVSNKEHKQLIMKYFEGAMGMGHGKNMMMNNEMMNRFYTSQCVWDNVFSDSILNKAENSNGLYVVIVGSGHVSYKLGANRRLKEKSDVSQASVFPVEVSEDEKQLIVSRAIGDFIIGFDSDSKKPFYPQWNIGAYDNYNLISVGKLFPGSPAARAGLKTGDMIISLDGTELRDVTHMNLLLSNKKNGDKAVFTIVRQGREYEVVFQAQ